MQEFGPPERLVVEERRRPAPQEGQLLVDVAASPVTFPDTLMIEDKYQFKATPPYVPGGEVAGVVIATRGRRRRMGRRRPGRRWARHDRWLRRAGGRAGGDGPPCARLRRLRRRRRTQLRLRHQPLRPQAPRPLQAGETLLVLGAGGAVGLVGGRARPAARRAGHRRRFERGEARPVPRSAAPTRRSTTPPRTSRTGPRSSPAARASTSSTTASAATRPSRRCGRSPGRAASSSSGSPPASRRSRSTCVAEELPDRRRVLRGDDDARPSRSTGRSATS